MVENLKTRTPEEKQILGYFSPGNVSQNMKRLLNSGESDRVSSHYFLWGLLVVDIIEDGWKISLDIATKSRKRCVTIVTTEIDPANGRSNDLVYTPDVYASKFGFDALKEKAVKAGLVPSDSPNH